jgi:hypothetical protein
MPIQQPREPSCLDAYGPDRPIAYRSYLDSYLKMFEDLDAPAPILSFDQYPFIVDGEENVAYFECLSIVRDKAAEYSRPGQRIPVWVIIQSSPRRARGVPEPQGPTPAQIRWQAWCAVAYGAKGIAYWTTAPYTDGKTGGGWGDGLIGKEGRPAARYAGIQALNRELHALGPTLMQLDAVSVFHVSTGRQKGVDKDVLGRSSVLYNIVSSVDASAGRDDCSIGYLKHATTGDDYLLVLNRSLTQARTFRVTLTHPATRVERVSRTNGALERVAADTRTFSTGTLAPASAELYRITDGIAEYVPGVTSIVERGDRVNFYTRDVTLAVDYATGRRTLGPPSTAGAAGGAAAATSARYRAAADGVVRLP